jgi:hypothetical protein
MHVCLLACLSMHVQNEVKSVSLGTVRKPLSVSRKTVMSVSLGMQSKQENLKACLSVCTHAK